ncbi:MAG: VWA domain-containing protein [Ignavibacteriales bacterium]|nr:MAG: VWA domain-containing protein [Ignavibacteriaceae bacterium]MBW7872068.1 VWA domain-containing protein [Ignavibacteria bacterium]MCZ2143702.1 VWA domain-containing protein [Ignavibacteriales bacterium]MBV6446035.1 hypothetical protein [Ignavibacteriaceae bacterium]MBZ0195737.1 VWA domain-containing protein [Ignavibacteriaceae bacterium]
MFSSFSFAYPWVLLALLIIPVLMLYRKNKKLGITPMLYSKTEVAKGFSDIRAKLGNLPYFLNISALAVMIIALARPQTDLSEESVYSEGIDISVVLDISSSMLAKDFDPDRLQAAKKITLDFVQGRKNDRIGLVIFAKDAFTQCPLTVDHNALITLMNQIESGLLEDGTAIGNAIATGVNVLRESETKSKVIILLTDGMNNAGEIDPSSAAEIAVKFGIRIYTIGVGTIGEAPMDVPTDYGTRRMMVPVEIDEPLLQKIAKESGGKYFRATDNAKLESIYNEIDRLEKSRIEVSSFKRKSEKFQVLLPFALGLIVLSRVLSYTWLRRLP